MAGSRRAYPDPDQNTQGPYRISPSPPLKHLPDLVPNQPALFVSGHQFDGLRR
jgi:hypothetical protein